MLSLGWYFFYFWVPWFLSTSIHIVDMPWFTIMFFFLSGFSSQILTIHRTGQGKRGDYLLFHSTTSTRSRTSRHLFATLHVRWLSRIFNCKACVYQTATRWDLSPYRTTIRWQKLRRKNVSNWVIFESKLRSFGYFECSTALWVILDPSCKSNLLTSLLGASGSDSHLTPKIGHLQKNGSCIHILDTTLVVEGKTIFDSNLVEETICTFLVEKNTLISRKKEFLILMQKGQSICQSP